MILCKLPRLVRSLVSRSVVTCFVGDVLRLMMDDLDVGIGGWRVAGGKAVVRHWFASAFAVSAVVCPTIRH